MTTRPTGAATEAPMPKPTAMDLRKVAEEADGTRGEDVYFEVKTDGLQRNPVKPSTSHVTVHTPWQGEGLRGEGKISVSDTNVSRTADAVFTTQSAWEKFGLPYYVRTKTLDELKSMLDEFYHKDVVCIYHEPKSDVDGGTRAVGLVIQYKDGTQRFI